MKAKFFFLILLFIAVNPACRSEVKKTAMVPEETVNGKVEVIYFHLTHRCATCTAIEALSTEVVSDMNNNEVSFTSYNLEEAEGKEQADLYGVSGQTLLLICGDEQVNLTDQAFLNARNNPDKFKALLKEKIDSFLE